MTTTLNIFDVSSMLYAGQCARAYSTPNDTAAENHNVEGLPIGGVRYTLRVALQKLKDNEEVLLVFDSKTDKQRLFADYKGNRTFNPAIMVQQLMLRDAAEKIGLPILQADNFEADDLVAAVIQKYLYNFSEIYIYTGDTDLAANIVADHVCIKGTASIYPSIDASTYEHTVKHGVQIPYNTILPYYAIYGKPSNNVPAVAGKADCDRYYSSFLKYASNNSIAAARLSEVGHFANWLLSELAAEDSVLSEDMIRSLYDRVGYIFPKPFTEPLELNFRGCKDFNIAELGFFLKTFNMGNELMWFGLYEIATNGKTPAMIDYIKRYKTMYFTGTLAVDNDIPADASFFDGTPSNFFLNEGDF